jgi:large subunit ribosomal protein L21
MFAIIKTGGKQYPAYPGKVLFVESLDKDTGSEIEFSGDNVLFFSDGTSNTVLSSPSVKVKAEVLEHKRAKKIIIFKKKRRKNYRRKTGHRQNFTVIRIKSID